MPTSISGLAMRAMSVLQENLSVRLAATVFILFAGLLLARVASRAVRTIWEARIDDTEEMVEKLQERRRTPDKLAEYIVLILTLAAALVVINANEAQRLASEFIAFTPQLVTALLVFFLGTFLVKGVMTAVRQGISNLDVDRYTDAIGVSVRGVDAFLAGVNLFLYLIVFLIALVQLGFSPQIISNTLVAASYGMVVLLVLLGFFGFKDLIHNYAAGIYLRGSEVLEPGKRVRLGDESGEVRDISSFSTTVSTDSGYFMLTPNARLMEQEILFKRVKAEIETLEDIKDYFVGGSTPYQGPAACEMALTMFGFDVTQGDITEKSGENPGPEELRDALKELTNNEIRTAFVETDKITDVGDEFKIWFNNGALLIPYFDKSVLFPGTDEDSYVLCVGVEGEELLVVDPSTSSDSGGVYYVDKDEMFRAIDGSEQGGYLVIAPRGTTAFWRIKNDLIYSSLSLYQQLSKSLEVQLGKTLRSGRVLKHIIPETVEDFTEKWREEDQSVTRMWTPENGGEKKLDEFTDNNG